MKPIIKAQRLGKQYRIGVRQRPAYGTLRDAVAQMTRAPLNLLRRRASRNGSNMFWALQDVNFEIAPGEVVGIVGSNGAGKSTLLKVLSRITEPTLGRVEIYGRVGSLLEVGTGFHPELTGRENVYLNGAILGMRRSEIQRQFDEIVAFAEIEKFLDTAVKHYSSGMYTRLAFAVAAHLQPEILLVDEVLAVGDVNFQKKCLAKMSEVAHEGRTVLFVSHNMTAIQSLCQRAIWLKGGKVEDDGEPKPVVTKYLKTSVSVTSERVWDDLASAPGNEKVKLHRASVRPADDSNLNAITVSTPLVVDIDYWNLAPGAYLNLSLVLYNEEGVALFNTGPVNEPSWHGKPFPAGLFRSSCYIPGNLLNDGTHRVQVYVVEDQSVALFRVDDLLVFEVLDEPERRSGWYGKVIGSIRPLLEWKTELIEAPSDALRAN
jgi:lipopolysaccharide transport system ATP-binding protein